MVSNVTAMSLKSTLLAGLKSNVDPTSQQLILGEHLPE